MRLPRHIHILLCTFASSCLELFTPAAVIWKSKAAVRHVSRMLTLFSVLCFNHKGIQTQEAVCLSQVSEQSIVQVFERCHELEVVDLVPARWTAAQDLLLWHLVSPDCFSHNLAQSVARMLLDTL